MFNVRCRPNADSQLSLPYETKIETRMLPAGRVRAHVCVYTQTDVQPENIMPPAPSSGGTKMMKKT